MPEVNSFLNSKIFGVLLILFLLIFYYVFTWGKQKKIENNKEVVEGSITALYIARGMSLGIKYNYVVNSNYYTGKGSISLDRKKMEFWQCLLVNRNFLVVFEKGSPSNSDILLRPADFLRYKLQIPELYKEITYYLDSVSHEKVPLNVPNVDCN